MAEPSTLAARAESLLLRASQDPRAAAAEAATLAVRARAAHDGVAEVLATRAQASALRRWDIGAALATAARAVELAEDIGDSGLADRARVTLGAVLVNAGRLQEAEALLEHVRSSGGPRARGEALCNLGALALTRGEPDRALRLLTLALSKLPERDLWRALALVNRGLVAAMSGRLEGAMRDLQEGGRLHSDLGSTYAAAEASFNLVWVLDLRGEYAAALRLLGQIEPVLSTRADSHGDVRLARTNLLLAVGLAGPAAAEASAAAEVLSRAGGEADRAEALSLLAQAHTMLGDSDAAARAGGEAERLFLEQDRPRLADRVRLLALSAKAGGTEAGPSDAARARTLAARLSRGGQVDVALQARLTAAALAMHSGRTGAAQRDLDMAAGSRTWPNPGIRSAYWRVQALIHTARGDDRAALAAARAGLEVLEVAQATMGATEARVNATATAEEFGRIALPAARARGAATLFEWTERVRAGALRFRPVRPPSARVLAREQADLRRVTAHIRDAEIAGADAGQARRRQAELERLIRTRLLTAEGRGTAVRRVSAAEVRAALGERVLISYADIAGTLVAVRLDSERARTIEIGNREALRREVEHLRFGLLRMARGRAPAGARASVAAAVRTLDAALLGRVDVTDRPLVVVPTKDLFAMPWGVLPGGRGRAVVVTPSALTWVRCGRGRRATGRQVVAAGPHLANAAAEVGEVAAAWPGARTFCGEAATAAALLDAVAGADIFHIACHGVLRADNPLFSYLEVADGPLAVHDIEGLRRAPATVVLSACDSALAQPRPGGEWLGMASALLSLGTRSLIASVLPVPDTPATVALMAGLHARLAAGAPPAEALRAAGAELDPSDAAAAAARAAFVCIGR